MLMRRWIGIAILSGATGIAAGAPTDKPQVRGAQTFYRMIPGGSNDMLPLTARTRAVVGRPGGRETGGTGMAQNFTEFPFERGVGVYGYRELNAYYPRLATLDIVQRRINVFDIVMDFPYVPDGVVWGQAYAEIGQTYTATRSELVGILLLVASPYGEFHVSVHEDGPGGAQIGSTRPFRSGASGEYGWARWMPGDVPTVPGRTYYIGMRRADGERWSPYLHATGDLYDGGMAWYDGRPEPETDLALYIVEQPDDMVRALQITPHEDGWTVGTSRVHFQPRSRNVRMIQVISVGPEAFCNRFVCHIRSASDPNRLIHGPMTYGLSCGRAGSEYLAAFVYGPKDVPLEPDEEIIVEIEYFAGGEHGTPVAEEPGIIERMQLTVYGDTEIDPVPVPSNQRVAFPAADTMLIAWDRSYPSPVEIEFRERDAAEPSLHSIGPAEDSLTVSGLEPGGVYWFTITAIGPTGRRWGSPVYQVQMPGGSAPPAEIRPFDHPAITAHPDAFLPLAPLPLSEPPRYRPSGRGTPVPLVNAGFEDGLAGWSTAGETRVVATGADYRIDPPEGAMMAGYHLRAGDDREQVFAENELYQEVAVEPGIEYELTAMVYTDAFGAPRGDVRVRLLANPAGRAEFSGHNSSQWYWTGGRWMRFTRRFTAETDRAVVGVGFFRWREMDRAIAYVDDIQLRRLGAPERR